MSVGLLDLIKQQTASLSVQEKFQLANYLLEQARSDQPKPDQSQDEDAAEQTRRQRMEWLKAHREEYAGQYVALEGALLVGQGNTILEARRQASQRGFTNPFLVRVTSENEVLL